MGDGPDFIGIGGQRCGSTWVAARLRQHPQIHMGPEKEISFWTHYFHRGYDWYHDQFKGKGDRIAGEITPQYMFSPRPDCTRLQHYPRWSLQSFVKRFLRPEASARDEIKKMYPGIKVFAVFRNPADRAWSHYWMWVDRRKARGKERFIVPFEKTFRDNGHWIQLNGRYATGLKYWRESFPDMGVFLYDDLVADPTAFISSIYRFLGVDDTFEGNITNREHAREYEPMSEKTREMLLDFYQDEIEEFSELIGRELPWLDRTPAQRPDPRSNGAL